MAKTFTHNYRYVRRDEDGTPKERVLLRAGDSVPSDLDKDEVARLEKSGAIGDDSEASGQPQVFAAGNAGGGGTAGERQVVGPNTESDEDDDGDDEPQTAAKTTASKTTGTKGKES